MPLLKQLNKIIEITKLKNMQFYGHDVKNLNDVNKVRNIGILAHIDAGKTTTTERMLFYSGMIRSMGEVHHGNTVTDYMDQERERGITITSASVSFNWRNHVFNLIDTPGHIDFTMEVEQTLNVLDGAVIVLDASAGVEAQTLTVWRQADRYNVPRIVYINKIDRLDADIDMCCESIMIKLDKPTILINLPIKEQGKLVGLIDVVRIKKLIWENTDRGKIIKTTNLTEYNDGLSWEKAKELRSIATDKLSDSDDHLAEMIIQSGSLENISSDVIVESLRKVTLKQNAIPVLCGSSYKNIGVQPLMDSVIEYLPSPVERNKQFHCFETNLCARAFKVIHDKHKGPLVFFRIYSGQFLKNQKIYNIHQGITEQSNRLLVAYADDFEEVLEVTNGNIAVVTGLKVDNISITLYFIEIGRGTSETMISAAVTQCLQKLLKEVGTQIWEPIMQLEIVTNEEHLSSVLADLSRRRNVIQNIDVRQNNKVVNTLTPLSELMGYSTDLRTITSGTATFSMEFHSYEQMSAVDEAKAIKEIVGF